MILVIFFTFHIANIYFILKLLFPDLLHGVDNEIDIESKEFKGLSTVVDRYMPTFNFSSLNKIRGREAAEFLGLQIDEILYFI